MDEQQPFPLAEEEIEIEEELEADPDDKVEQEDRDFAESDELLPKPAFHIEEDHEHLTEQEKQAFSYIIAVRSQKQAILKRKRQTFNPTNHHAQSLTKINVTQQTDHLDSLKEWRAQVVNNWKCVIANIKYLQSHPQQMKKEKLNGESLNQIPQIHRLCYNKWLSLSQIERTLVDFSNLHIEYLDTHHDNKYFHLWIYSLLGLHQSYASYNNFQALASINAAMEKQYKHIVNFYEVGSDPLLSKVQVEIGWLINVIILIDAFKQNFLLKLLTPTLINKFKTPKFIIA